MKIGAVLGWGDPPPYQYRRQSLSECPFFSPPSGPGTFQIFPPEISPFPERETVSELGGDLRTSEVLVFAVCF